MQGARWWLVCYDVRPRRRRGLRKAAKHMEGYGERMQYSVFRCWLTRLEMERLRWELTEMLTPEDDVLLIPLCARPAWPAYRAGRTERRTHRPGRTLRRVIELYRKRNQAPDLVRCRSLLQQCKSLHKHRLWLFDNLGGP